MPVTAQNPELPWVIDYDDNTIFNLYAANFGFQQFLQPVENICQTVEVWPTGTLTMIDPLPANFGYKSGSISRFSDRLSIFVEETTPARTGISTEATLYAIANDLPIGTVITRYDFINVESVGTSDGSPSQTFTLNIIVTPTF